MTRLRTNAALQRAIRNHTDSQTGEIVMANNQNPNAGMPDGRNSPDYGNIRLGGERPVSLFYRGMVWQVPLGIAVLLAIIALVPMVTP